MSIVYFCTGRTGPLPAEHGGAAHRRTPQDFIGPSFPGQTASDKDVKVKSLTFIGGTR